MTAFMHLEQHTVRLGPWCAGIIPKLPQVEGPAALPAHFARQVPEHRQMPAHPTTHSTAPRPSIYPMRPLPSPMEHRGSE